MVGLLEFVFRGAIFKRLKLMLVPTISMFLMYVFVYWGNLSSLGYCALGEYKFGYWFTFALFLMNIIHWLVSEIFKLFRFDERKTTTYSLCFQGKRIKLFTF